MTFFLNFDLRGNNKGIRQLFEQQFKITNIIDETIV